MKPFSIPDDLDAVLADVWARLVRGAADRHSAYHTPVVATHDEHGPRQRIMVLRAVDPATATLRFHTDRRSGKVATIGNGAPVSILGYDPGARIQISGEGRAQIIAEGPEADAAWAASRPSSRRCYLAKPGSGTAVDAAISGIPEAYLERTPTLAESEPGREHFAVVMVTLERLEWVELTAGGNRRAAFERGADGWAGTWLIP